MCGSDPGNVIFIWYDSVNLFEEVSFIDTCIPQPTITIIKIIRDKNSENNLIIDICLKDKPGPDDPVCVTKKMSDIVKENGVNWMGLKRLKNQLFD